MRLLDIGCGDRKRQGALGLDIQVTKDVDVIADARKLPFRDEAFDHVYSSHVLEYFSHREVLKVLRKWIRVLKPVE